MSTQSPDPLSPVATVYDAMGERPRASAQPVDVLAVLDRALMLVNDDDDHDGQPFDTDKSAEVYAGLAQARAAVAELVEAAKEVRAFLTHDQWGSYHYMEGSEVYGELREHAERLRAALARVQGGAA